jgi:hypothetical protein
MLNSFHLPGSLDGPRVFKDASDAPMSNYLDGLRDARGKSSPPFDRFQIRLR